MRILIIFAKQVTYQHCKVDGSECPPFTRMHKHEKQTDRVCVLYMYVFRDMVLLKKKRKMHTKSYMQRKILNVCINNAQVYTMDLVVEFTE